jgi:hypothetical protein
MLGLLIRVVHRDCDLCAERRLRMHCLSQYLVFMKQQKVIPTVLDFLL